MSGVSRRAQENVAVLLLLALFAGVIWLCQDFGPRARLIPLPLAVFGVVLAVVQLVWQNMRSTDELHMDMISVQAPAPPVHPGGEAEREGAGGGGVTWRKEALALGIVGALYALILAVGIIPAVFLFTGGYFVVTREYSWTASLIYTAILTASIYLLFVVALQIQPYHGLLAPLVGYLG